MTASHSLSLAVCQLHHFVSPQITNYKGYSFLHNQIVGRNALRDCQALGHKFWQHVFPNPSEYTEENLSFSPTVIFRISLFISSLFHSCCVGCSIERLCSLNFVTLCMLWNQMDRHTVTRSLVAVFLQRPVMDLREFKTKVRSVFLCKFDNIQLWWQIF